MSMLLNYLRLKLALRNLLLMGESLVDESSHVNTKFLVFTFKPPLKRDLILLLSSNFFDVTYI